MGQLGQALAGPHREKMAAIVRRAAADEWHAHYNFHFVAGTLAGHHSPAVVDLLQRLSSAAVARAARLERRLAELGGRPAERLAEVVDAATDKPFKLPADPADVTGALRAVLDAVRTGLRTYDALWKESRDHDPVTAALAVRFLSDALSDEETIERLTGDPAPQMRG